MKMKILYLCHNFATFILNEIIQIKKQGHDVLIMGENTSRIYEIINKPILVNHGLIEQYYGFFSGSSRQQKYPAFLKGLLYDFLMHPICATKVCFYLMTKYPHPKYGIVDYLDVRNFFGSGITLIHAPFSVPSILAKVSLLSKILNVPYTLSFKAHDIWQGNNLAEAKKKVETIEQAAQIFTIAMFNRMYLENQFDTNKGIEVIHDAIDVDFFKPNSMERKPNAIVSVSRLHPEKGLINLVRACHILNQRQIDYHCTLIGDGPEKQKYERLIDEFHIPNIFFAGFLPQDQVRDLLQTSAVFVLPSVIDSDGLGDILPNGVKEAMSMQVPVITSNIRGIDELVVDGVHGILVPPGNPQAIADAIEQIISRPILARKLGEEGRRKIEKEFNLPTEVGKIEKIFTNAITQASK